MATKAKGIDKDLEAAVSDMLKSAKSKDMPLEDKLSIIDRALKLQALKLKLDESGQGSAWEEEGQ